MISDSQHKRVGRSVVTFKPTKSRMYRSVSGVETLQSGGYQRIRSKCSLIRLQCVPGASRLLPTLYSSYEPGNGTSIIIQSLHSDKPCNEYFIVALTLIKYYSKKRYAEPGLAYQQRYLNSTCTTNYVFINLIININVILQYT